MCGLKRLNDHLIHTALTSHPIRDAWIETSLIETDSSLEQSHPIRDAWIETILIDMLDYLPGVASHTGCVD